MATINQFPKNKNIDSSLLSSDQTKLRKNISNTPNFKIKQKLCKECLRIHPISNFYYRKPWLGKNGYWRKGTYRKECKDCRLKAMGVVEIGKIKFAREILKKKFRRCSVCKEIKPLIQFNKYKNWHGGHSNNCRECCKILNKKYTKLHTSERNSISTPYIIRYAKQKGYKKIFKKTINKLRLQIKENRKPKYFLDNKSFISGRELARYIEKKYGILATCVVQRIAHGYTEKQCTFSEYKFRSMALIKGYEKGKPKYFLDRKGFSTASAFCRYVKEEYGINETCVRQRLDGGYSEKQCIYKGRISKNRKNTK